MGATFSRLKNWIVEVLNYADLNAEIDNILTNLTPTGVDDYSVNAAQMRTQTTPGAVGSESLAQSMAEELARLRFVIARAFGVTYWYTDPGVNLVTIGASISNLNANRISSGRSRADSSQLIALVPHGTLARVTLKGATTPFVFYVSNVAYTISSDVNLALATAPLSNNTALTDLSTGAPTFANTFAQLKYMGELGTRLPFDTAGSEIASRSNILSAFKVNNGVTNEYFMGTPVFDTGSSTDGGFDGAHRGFFFNDVDAPIPRISVDNNRTVTLMKLAYIFANTSGTLAVTYNPLKVQGAEPTGPASGDYWFDTVNGIWKTYSGTWVAANATFIGWAICDGTACVAARTFNIFAQPTADNTLKLIQQTNSTIAAIADQQKINVNGRDIEYVGARPTWDMATDLESGVTETASTMYFFYINEYGTTKISDLGPYDRPEFFGYYHPYHNWRCVGQAFNDASSNLLALIDYRDSDAYAVTNHVSANACLVLLHCHPGKIWTGHKTESITGADGSFQLQVPFLMQITVPSGATLGGLGVTDEPIHLYLYHSSRLLDLAVSGRELILNHEDAPSSGTIAIIGTGSDSGNALYGNAVAAAGSYRVIPTTKLRSQIATPGTWDAACVPILQPLGFPAAAMPPGAVSAYAGTTAPTGWLLCNGAAINRITYAALFAVIGEFHGEGDNSTTFNVPDYRGRFLRGVDGATARDPDAAGRTAMATGGNTGDNVGSLQAAAFASHTHSIALRNDGTFQNGNFVQSTGNVAAGGTGTDNATGGNETRPINAYVNYIIKT